MGRRALRTPGLDDELTAARKRELKGGVCEERG